MGLFVPMRTRRKAPEKRMSIKQAPIASGFGPTTTASETIRGINLTGKNVVVTGGYAGIGLETTRSRGRHQDRWTELTAEKVRIGWLPEVARSLLVGAYAGVPAHPEMAALSTSVSIEQKQRAQAGVGPGRRHSNAVAAEFL